VEATGANLVFQIIGGNLGGTFDIGLLDGRITVLRSALLNAALRPTFTLRVRVYRISESGSFGLADIRINVVTANIAPVVLNQTFVIPENLPQSAVVGLVVATDVNAGSLLKYEIVEGNENGAFTLDQRSGVLRVADPSILNFEITPTQSFRVRVTDTGTIPFSREAVMTVNLSDVNDLPRFSSDAVTNATQDVEYVYMAAFADEDAGDALTFTLNQKPGWLTSVENGDGMVTLSGSPANADVGAQLVSMTVEDLSGTQDTQEFTIEVANVNDSPQAVDQVFSILENSPNGSVVGTVAASDPDVGDAITFTIESGNDDGIFALDRQSGELRVTGSSRLDHEERASVNLTVKISDNGRVPQALSTTVEIVIDIIDRNEPPTAAPHAFVVPENSLNGFFVGQVAGVDDDAGDVLSYTISLGNIGGAFAVDSLSGAITVNDAIALDLI
ncbi:MAG: cadherin domain-containing protein, partial [Verrucomicrobiia bacterium]